MTPADLGGPVQILKALDVVVFPAPGYTQRGDNRLLVRIMRGQRRPDRED